MEALSKRKVGTGNREWYEKFRWFTSSDGFLVVAGKDTVSNEVLIKKYAKQEDVVFHAEISGAPFTVVKTEGKPSPKLPSGSRRVRGIFFPCLAGKRWFSRRLLG